MAISTAGNSKIFYSFNNCSSSFKTHVSICSINFSLIPNSYHYSIKSTRSINGKRASEHLFRVPTIFCVVEDTNETRPESIKSSASSDSTKEPAFNLNLPRRSLLATFTCNACGVRSQKLINRLAYERGTVFIQCSGCSQYHKLVDNLGLVVEYNFKDEISMDLDADQD
ncbi:putative tRNA(adenine(34)) deaminase, chloroplastic-like [Capsicum annuum]|uniref:DNL-type domain-containing protein n=2 Tax=Capsicum annuum TaxID=4072 RepID=A0A2G2YCP8_CAPAN|nr:putative tRNA(adenine(34)) deaminase, chloroplastic-like [Capsicum annuum]PHT67479.1 hypothetical protein T459_26966 [Capsicum annuum]